jgi:hypothetical protein
MTRLGWGAFFLVLFFLAIQVMPRALGQRESAGISKRSSDVEAPLLNQQAAPLTPAEPGVGCTLNGTLGTAPPGGGTGTLTTRINRPGTPTATCAGVTWPGTIGGGSYYYNVHYVTNTTGSPLCTTVTFTMLTEGTPQGSMLLSAFKAPFVAADITNEARYLGDAGQSSNNPGVHRTFQFTVPVGTTIALVVANTELVPAGFGGTYEIVLSQDLCGTVAGAPIRSDFNGDDKSDILWQNSSTGQRVIWIMNGTTFQSAVSLGTVATSWSIAGSGDFNGDGKSDILWQNSSTGQRVIWIMNGTTFQSAVSLGTVATSWSIAGSGDFNGDGRSDILWQNSSTGQRVIWIMDGTTLQSFVSLGTVATSWSIAGSGDFSGDGKADILWQNSSTGQRVIWIMDGTTLQSFVSLGTVATSWSITGSGDFNGDGRSDILWQNSSTGQRVIWIMNGTTLQSAVSLGFVATSWSTRNY